VVTRQVDNTVVANVTWLMHVQGSEGTQKLLPTRNTRRRIWDMQHDSSNPNDAHNAQREFSNHKPQRAPCSRARTATEFYKNDSDYLLRVRRLTERNAD
jgi:hypothetical protein